MADADLIRENAPESLELKKDLLIAAGAAAKPAALIASSTSGYRPNQLQDRVAHPERVLVAHPFSPVYLLQLVEVVGGAETDLAVVGRAADFYRRIGMHPLIVRREIDGHLSDRLQEALRREALHQVNNGIATTDELDQAIVDGPGLRWALMGVDHLQMAFVDGSVDRIADGAAGMAQSGAQIGQFDEVFKVRERRVAPVAAIPAYERRAICRHEDRRVAANLHATRGVAGVLDELPRVAGDQLPAQAGRHAHPLPLDRRACCPSKGQRLVVDKVDTDFRQDAVGVGLQQCQSFIAMHLVERKMAGEIGARRAA